MTTHKRGFTLAELLVVLVLLSFVGGAIVALLVRQQRFFNGVQSIIDTRRQIRQAGAMLPGDLRSVSGIGGDIYAMTDSSIDVRATTGSSVVCLTNTVSKFLYLVPVTLAKNNVMTSLSMTPGPNDSVLVYDDGANTSLGFDDSWRTYGVSALSIVPASNCPTATGLVQTADQSGSNSLYRLTLPVTQTTTIKAGSAVRFFKRVHYSLYHAPDGSWYLGYYDCKLGRVPNCAAIQPIAGPLNAYAAAGTNSSGLQFTYYDSLGVVTSVPANVARISLVARGRASNLVTLTGLGSTAFGDSVRIEIGLRNRK
jgi:prepilin-type N-terminal cleavage/methylation domain-containing protein